MDNYPLLNLFWTMLMFFFWVAWILLLVRIVGDLFRSPMSGLAKAAWMLAVVILPFLGTLAYLLFRGSDMHTREAQAVAARESAVRSYIRESAGPVSVADELSKLAALREQGVLNEDEFETQKALVLAK